MANLQIGVCTWSLAIPDLGKTLATVKDTLKLNVIHLGFFDDGYKEPNKIIDMVKASGLTVSATCVGFAGEDYASIARIAQTGGYMPDDAFEDRYAKTVAVADITTKLGTDMLSVHIGFVPEDHKDPKHGIMVDRIRRLADALGQRGVKLVMETGQESPESLVAFMDEVARPNLGVNFDPANMILYGMGDPVEALRLLMPHVMQVHLKDATPTATPGQWGAEVPLGTGAVDWKAFFRVLNDAAWNGNLCIEREAGEQRIEDIRSGLAFVAPFIR